MEIINFDQASTTFPKPSSVPEAVYEYMTKIGYNISRSSYDASIKVGEMVLETRQLLCDFFDGDDPANVCFTKNITESLNVILKGFLRPGDHVLVSSLEHNSVMRPLTELSDIGVTYTKIPSGKDGTMLTQQLEDCLTPNTRLLLTLHASNVCGTVQPIKELGLFCKTHNLKFVVDTAQTAGHLPISMKKCHIDALCFTGHKGLYGPQGIGGFILKKEMVPLVSPLISGGTGSLSHTESIPPFMPDRFEAGTLNLPGIAGLHASLLWLTELGLTQIRTHEELLCSTFLKGLKRLDPEGKKIVVLGISDSAKLSKRVGVIALSFPGLELHEVAYRLETEFGILTRVGLHCAPSAHKTLGTFPEGCIRFSIGYFNTIYEIQQALFAIEQIIKKTELN